MKKVIALILFAVLVFENVYSVSPFNLNVGMPVLVKCAEDWNAKNSGQPKFVVAYNVMSSNGELLIREGSPVVTNATIKTPRGVGKQGTATINFVSTVAMDGQAVLLTGSTNISGKNKAGVAHGVTWSLFFLVLGPLALPCLAIKGGHAIIETNYQATSSVVSPLQVNVPK